MWEAGFKATDNSGEFVQGQGGSSLDLDGELAWGGIVQYNINNHFAVSGEFSWSDPNYQAKFPLDTPGGGTVNVDAELDILDTQFKAVFNFFDRVVTPYAEIGYGWTVVDSRTRKARSARATAAAPFSAAGAQTIKQRTLKKSVVLSGQGLHSGVKTGLILHPLPVNSGILFTGISGDVTVPAHLDYVGSTGYATSLRSKDLPSAPLNTFSPYCTATVSPICLPRCKVKCRSWTGRRKSFARPSKRPASKSKPEMFGNRH